MRLTLIHANKRVPWWYSGNRLSLLQDVFVYFKISVIWTFLKVEFCFTILHLTHNIQSEVIERWAKESLSVRIPELTMCHVNTLWIHNHGGFGMTTLVTDAQDTIVHLRLDLEIGGFPAQKNGNRWPPHMWTNINKVEASKHVLAHWGRGKMAAIFQTTSSNEFSWMKMCEYRLKFHWNLFLRVQLTISDNGLAPTRRQVIIWTNDA